MRVLITGGAGFIGSHLAEELLKKNYEVWALDNLSTGTFLNIRHLEALRKFKFFYGSVVDALLMQRLVNQCDAVVHLAAAVGVKLIVEQPVETIITNVRGTEILLQLATAMKKKVLIASSSEVYGKNNKVPFCEEDDLVLGNTAKFRWSYACSKAIDEYMALAYFKQYNLPVVVMRFFNTVGARQTGQYGMVLPSFVSQAVAEEALTVYGDGRQRRTFTYVKDVVRGVAGLLNCPGATGQVFNLGGKEEISILDLALKVKALAKSRSPICMVPYEKAYGADFEDIQRRVPDLAKIKKLIGYDPQTGIEEMILSVLKEQKRRMKGHGREQTANKFVRI